MKKNETILAILKKNTAIVLSLALILGAAPVAYCADDGRYTDIKEGNWAYEAVVIMSDAGIVKGYPNGSFKPSDTVTYGEFIKMALIADTKADPGNSTAGNWALNYYNTSIGQGYFTAHDINDKMLERSIPRSDMALIVSSILGDVKISDYDKLQAGITDVNAETKGEYHITKAYATGMLTGYDDNTFKPEGTLTRAEAATVIHRLTDESKRVKPNLEKTLDKAYIMVNTADYFDPATVENFYHVDSNFTVKAEFYSDPDGVGLKMNRKWDATWGCSFDHTMVGFVYLVKDGKIVSFAPAGPRYDADGNFLNYFRSSTGEKGYDVALADYIVCVPGKRAPDDFLVKIVVNPFKAK